MALDDVVQTVSIEGGDEAAQAFKNIGQAGAEAFSDILDAASKGDFTGLATLIGGETAGAFAKLAEEVLHAGEELLAFVKNTADAIESTAALSNAFGTTLEQTDGLREAFAAGGVSTEALDRSMQRMAVSVASSWASIQQSVRTSAEASESAINGLTSANLNLEKAQEHASEVGANAAQQAVDNSLSVERASIGLIDAQQKAAIGQGKVDPALASALNQRKQILAVEEAEQALIKANAKAIEDSVKSEQEEKEAALAVQDAHIKVAEAAEHANEVQLKDLPAIAQQLNAVRDGYTGINNSVNLADVDVQNLQRAFILAASSGGQLPSAFQVLENLAKTFENDTAGIISEQTRLELVTRLVGSSMRNAAGGAAKMLGVLEGGTGTTKAFADALEAGQQQAKALGLTLTGENKAAAEEFSAEYTQLATEVGQALRKLGAELTPLATQLLRLGRIGFEGLIGGIEAVSGAVQAIAPYVTPAISLFAQLGALEFGALTGNINSIITLVKMLIDGVKKAINYFQQLFSSKTAAAEATGAPAGAAPSVAGAVEAAPAAGFADGGIVTVPGFARGGIVPKIMQRLAEGGGPIKGPGTGTSDSILGRLSNGEFVMRAAAVRAYGASFFDALNDMRLGGGFAAGGLVTASSLPRFAGGGAAGKIPASQSFNLLIGNRTFPGLKAPESVAESLKNYAISQQTSQTGRPPSWAR